MYEYCIYPEILKSPKNNCQTDLRQVDVFFPDTPVSSTNKIDRHKHDKPTNPNCLKRTETSVVINRL
jgi:hypothetical protein